MNTRSRPANRTATNREKGKRVLRTARRKKRIFISFDFDHDRSYRYLLSALNSNTGSDIEFDDRTSRAIRSNDVGRVKAALAMKIGEATHVLVIVGEHANAYHPDSLKIGDRNWQWWEINRTRLAGGKRFIGVKIRRANPAPVPLKKAGATWAHSFNVPAMLRAIREA